MSYSMSPPQKPAPRPYSPYQNQNQNATSPMNASPYGPPPAKRQRMSPDPRSPPNGAPGYGPTPTPHGLPNTLGGYGNPYAPSSALHSPYASTPTYAGSPPASFHNPQPYPYPTSPWQSHASTPTPQQQQSMMHQASPPSQQSREMMPPPPRPNKDEREERVGVEEIGDSLFGSGINLKDEENYMHTMYNNRHTQGDSFSTNQNTSFGSSTMSPNNSFNLLTQGTSFGSQGQQDGAFAGTLRPPQSQEDIELEARRKREAAARALAERRQHHLNNQFLLCNNVRKRMDRLALNQGVTLLMQGVYLREPQTTVMVDGSGSEGIVAAEDRVTGVQRQEQQAESIVNQNTPFEQIVSLVSLAAGERVRGLVDDAFKMARARRYGDHGRVVPPEFADIAEGEDKRSGSENVVPDNITGTQWDKVPDHDVLTIEENDTPKSKPPTPQPATTLSYQGTLNAHLRALAEKDKAAEATRLQKRLARKRAAEALANGDTNLDTPADAAAPTTNTTTATGETSSDATAPKLTKKEALKQQKAQNSSTEAQLQQTTNQTAAMMALGRKGRRYDWMTGGAASMPTNRFAKSTPPGTNPANSAAGSGAVTPVKGEGATPPGVGTAMARVGSAGGGSGGGAAGEGKVAEWGDWREDGVGGEGIQIRDWVLVLERDGREKGALERAVGRMG